MASMFAREEKRAAKKSSKIVQPVPVPEESKVDIPKEKNKRSPTAKNRGLGKKTIARRDLRAKQDALFSRTNSAGIQIRTFPMNFQDQSLTNAAEVLDTLEKLENERTIVYVRFRVIMVEEKEHRDAKDKKEMGLIMNDPSFPNNIQPMVLRPREAN